MTRKMIYVERLNCLVTTTLRHNEKSKDITKTKEFWEELEEIS
jgi:hypothetical protein